MSTDVKVSLNYGSWNFYGISFSSLMDGTVTSEELRKLLALDFNPSPSITNFIIQNGRGATNIRDQLRECSTQNWTKKSFVVGFTLNIEIREI